jgi:UDP-N-acetylglucosamine 2-epimerase (non-hydrolysing)
MGARRSATRRVMVVFGTRPEAIKLAPVIRAMEADPGLEPIVVVTAQHREMLDQVLDLFGIRPDHDLHVMAARPNLSELTVRVLDKLSGIVSAGQPDGLVVQGDTTTTFVSALSAFYHHVPVMHVEAGLRTRRPDIPFPEEMNRRLTSRLAALHLAPTAWAAGNLLAERTDPARVVVTGNTGIDALRWAASLRRDYADPALDGLDHDHRRVLLVTAHRRESWGRGLEGIAGAVRIVAEERPDVLVVFPVHRNPVVRQVVTPALSGLDNVLLVEPLDYGSFVHLMTRADVILTDSGGIQEEAPSLGKPVLVMRDVTERPEAIVAGTSRLVGTDHARLVAEVERLFDDADAYAEMAVAVNPYGDGEAAARAVAAMLHFFGDGPPADPFRPTVTEREISLVEEPEDARPPGTA